MGMPAQKQPPAIELSVRLVDGSFETKIQIPADATDEQRRGFVEAWLQLMERAVEMARK